MDPRIRIFVFALILTVIFHETIAKVPYGVSLGLFSLGFLSVFSLATRWNKPLKNPWALAFLVPALISMGSASWYASAAIQTLAWFVAIPALALFSYWITSPARSWRDAFSFTPPPFFQETVWPFHRFRDHLSFSTRISSGHVWQIVLGLAVGFPLLWIIASLFSAADSTFAAVLETVFHWNIFPTTAGAWLLDFLAGLFFLGFIGVAVRRYMHPQEVSEQEIALVQPYKDSLALHTFLVTLNALFLVFSVIQILYVIQGTGHWIVTGLSYADYAKQSFYQLFWVGVLVFGIVLFCYRVAGIKRPLTRILLLILLAQTAIVLASAWLRLSLYISVYNLTLARWWGGVGLLVLASFLIWSAFCLLRQTALVRFIQGLFVSAFLLAIPLLLVNHEGHVAEYNIYRYLHDETTILDTSYLLDLSSDAVPALTQLLSRAWPVDPNLQLRAHNRCNEGELEITCLRRRIETHRQMLEFSSERDWRLLTRSDWSALKLLSSLK